MNSPNEIAKNYVSLGQSKVRMPLLKMLVLGILAGAFIGFGGVASTTAAVSVKSPSLARLVTACVFPGGLTMVLLAGSELFTGNCLLVIPLLEKKIRVVEMLKNWVVVYIGNLIGGILVAALCVFSHQASLFDNGVALSMITTAAGKMTLTFSDAFFKAVGCNFLVCIAVWISFAATQVVGKIAALFFPIMLFVLCGFEHSVANMYYLSSGIFAASDAGYAKAALDAVQGLDLSVLTWSNMFFQNLLPVTLGNIVGGAIFVGAAYWFIYLKDAQ